MILKENVEKIVLSGIEGKSVFLVEVKVKHPNRIVVEVDKPEGITIEECAEISRWVESMLDREVEDFELEVSSPGLTEPLKVIGQYRKNCGKPVNVLQRDGEKINGILRSVNEEGIVLEVKTKVGEKGKKLQTVVQPVPLKFGEIKTTKVTITF
ncbi:MAG: ribosome assembly cofactor RimP [Bacteroidales bacterium]|jgi:ribosome maturation factor RimP|nr:ribosome assembly cofactor RimP [Bacteroidales bacterium]